MDTISMSWKGSLLSSSSTMSGPKSDKNKSSSVKRLDSSLFFLKWTKTALQAYTRSVNELYLKVLLEHTTGRKTEAAENSDEVEQLAAGPKVEDKSETHSIRERLREAAHRNTLWEGKPVIKGKDVCVAEVAAQQRLAQLVKASGKLLEIMDRTHKWSDKNYKLLKKHSISVDIIDHVMTMFEATCHLGEAFRLTAVDRTPCKDVYKEYLRKRAKDDYESTSSEGLQIGDPKKYIPPLEAKINHYRTVVHILGTSLVSIIQNYLRYIPQEQVDLRVREVKDVLDQLPPMYLKVQETNLSKAACDLLKETPPNKRSYPLAPKDDCSARTRSGKTVRSAVNKSTKSRKSRRSERSIKVEKSKYKNPINSSKSDRSRRNKDSDTEQRSKKTQESEKTEKSEVKKSNEQSGPRQDSK